MQQGIPPRRMRRTIIECESCATIGYMGPGGGGLLNKV